MRMSQVTKQIYRELNKLIPELEELQPFEKLELTANGFAAIQLMVLDTSAHEMQVILSRYDPKRGVLLSNPSIEMTVYPEEQEAEVVTYKDKNFAYQLLMDAELDNEPDNQHARSYANRLVYEWLKELKGWSCSKGESLSPLWLP